MMVATVEPDGQHVRRVEPMRQEDARKVWDKLKEVTNFAGKVGFEALCDPKLEIVTIDEVGVAVLDDQHQGLYGRVHITFWDKRLRGREYLCRRIAQVWMDKYGYDYVYTSIPTTSRTVIAFAKRVGFEALVEDEEFVHLILYNSYLLRVNSPSTGD